MENIDENKYFKCRMYSNTLPHKKDMVVITYKEIRPEMGILVTLNEYDNRDAIIYFPEFTRRKRIKSYSSLCHIGHIGVAEVLNVDPEHITLSKRYLNEADEKKHLSYFEYNKRLLTIMKKIAIKINIDLLTLQSQLVWPLFNWIKIDHDIESSSDEDDDSILNEHNKDSEPESKDSEPESKDSEPESKDYEPESKDSEPESKDSEPEIIINNRKILKLLDNNKYYHPYLVFRDINLLKNLIFPRGLVQVKNLLLENFDSYFGIMLKKMTIHCKLLSFDMNGTQKIQEAFTKCLRSVPENIKMELLLNQSPNYQIFITGSNSNDLESLKKICSSILSEEFNSNNNGIFQLAQVNINEI